MGKALYLHRFPANDIGNGGFHRCYQVMRDLEQSVGRENVFSYQPRIEFPYDVAPHPQSRKSTFLWKVWRSLKLAVKFGVTFGSPYKLYPYMQREIMAPYPLGRVFIDEYNQYLSGIPHPNVCIIDHPSFFPILSSDRIKDIPVIYCPHNIESLDMNGNDPMNALHQYMVTSSLVEEINHASSFHERLCISKIEVGFFGGLGLESHYYPYLPVGEIRKRMYKIRELRLDGVYPHRFFLVMGTAIHTTTGNAFKWLLQQVQQKGLPDSIKIIFCGEGTEQLLPAGVTIPGIELRGWVGQEELDLLMSQSQAVLVPQFSGFGALTRISELSCAGIPAIVSQHAVIGQDIPPGIYPVGKDWALWCSQMITLSQNLPMSQLLYEEWEQKQSRTLPEVIKKYIK